MDSIISDADLRAIELAANQNKNHFHFFQKIFRKKKVVKNQDMPGHTVRLNSLVLVWHSILKKVVKIRIVLPKEEDMKLKNISVFAPISLALFGRRVNDSIHLRLPGIKKELRIIKVISK